MCLPLLDRRRWLVAVAFVAGALSFHAAVAGGGSDPAAAGKSPPDIRTPVPSLQGRTIRVGLPSPIGARGMLRGTREDPQGYLKTLFELVAQTEGLTVEFVPLDKESGKIHNDELEQGRIDVLAGMTVGETNLRKFRLSAPVVVTPGVAVTREGTPPPRTVADLRALRIAVPAGGAGRTFAAEQNLTVVPHPQFRGGFDAVVAGNADVFLTTRLAAAYQIDKEGEGYKGLRLTELEPVGFRRAYAYAVRVDDGDLMLAIESGLLALHQDGRLKETYESEVSRFQPLTGPRNVELSSVLHVAAVIGAGVLLLVLAWQWRMRRTQQVLARGLSESEQRYRGIFAQSQDAILIVDPAKRTVIEANPAAERIYGYGPGEMTGVFAGDLLADPGALSDRVEKVVHDGSTKFSRSQHRRRDGRRVLIDVHASIGTIDGRKVIVALNRDVTAATSYEEWIRSVIETSPHVSIQAFDRNGCVHFWNEASTRLYGWTAQEAIGRKVGELLGGPQDQAALVEMLARLESERRPSGLMEFQLHNKSGEPRWVLSEIVPAPNLQGELQFVCVDIDVSAMKSAERRLQDAQAKLASALEAAGMGTWSIDVRTQLIDPDPSLLRLLGGDPAKAVPVPFERITASVHPEDRDGVIEALRATMRGEAPYVMENRVVLSDGTTRWLSSRAKVVRDAGGAPVAISGASIDITEAKLAAADADRLRDELERARRLESLGLLAGGLAHDFNNLLVGIRGNTELAVRSLAPDSPAHRALDLVVQATDRTADLTNQLLAAAGRSRLAPERINLNAITVESVALLRPRLGHGVTVNFDLAEPAVCTRADGAQTRQALSNLLTNAADALRPKGGTITVRTGARHVSRQEFESDAYKVRSAPGDYAFIEVCDNGCGMDEGVLARVFDPFYTTKDTGRGLGLSLVMMTVRRHDGAIRIQTRLGEGTACMLLLPLVVTDTQAEQPPAPTAPRRAGRALVIDDEPMVRQVIAGMLKQDGWTTTEVASGEAGVRCAAGEPFDIVFLDLTMPGMSGIETAAVLRATMPRLPIVFVSGYSRELVGGGGGGNGTSGGGGGAGGALAGEVFVQKPFDSSTLYAAAAEALDRAAGPLQRAGDPPAVAKTP